MDTVQKYDRVLLAILGVSLALNLILGTAILRSNSSPSRTLASSRQLPAIGSTVPDFEATREDGTRQSIRLNGTDRDVVLYIIRSSCVWCERNEANIQALIKGSSPKFNFIGLSLGTVSDDYRQRYQSLLALYTNPSRDAIGALKLGVTPQTIVVSKGGKILKAWAGAYSGPVAEEVQQFFGVPLPGMKN